MSNSARYLSIANLEFDGQDIATLGLQMNDIRTTCDNIKASKCATYGVKVSTAGGSRIEVTDMKAAATAGIQVLGPISYSIAHNNPCPGFDGEGIAHSYCIAAHNTGGTSDGFQGAASLDHCIAFGNGRDGAVMASSGDAASMITNCIFAANGQYGVNSTRVEAFTDYNAFWNNTSGARNGLAAGDNDVTLTGDPFTNSASGSLDFSLNDTAGAGAACRNVGYQTDPTGNTVGYIDIGFARHQDAGGGGSNCIIGG
jgi:hypothetical protein